MNIRPMSDYGSLGKIGIGTPQANPTAEAELAILLPRACSTCTTRLTSRAESPEARLRAYLVGLEAHLMAYDTLRPDVFGFACSGASYLLGAREEERAIARAAARFGYPVETASRAVLWSLLRLRAQRIALVTAYPVELVEAAIRYWSEAGIEVAHTHRIRTRTADTRDIYRLTSNELATALDELPRGGIDAVVVSGTGLRSLAVLRAMAGDARAGAVPVISSNMCLAARVLDLLGHAEWLDPRLPFIHGWEDRLDEALRPAPPARPRHADPA
jgi:maleate isomerase